MVIIPGLHFLGTVYTKKARAFRKRAKESEEGRVIEYEGEKRKSGEG